MRTKPVLLGMFAHPDDESYGAGGTLARYAAEGVDVYVVIATDGASGGDNPPGDGRSLAETRAAEMANAAAILGLADFWILPYRDSGMRGSPDNQHPQALIQQPPESLTQDLVGLIRRNQPQVVVTHDPFGGYGHPDHIRVSQAATEAFFRAGRAAPRQTEGDLAPYVPQKLYYTTMDKRLIRLAVRLMAFLRQDPTRFGRNRDIDLLQISQAETPVHAQIDVSAYARQKDSAIQAHASQYNNTPGLMRALLTLLRRYLFGKESFSRAHPAPAGPKERDLFAGVVLE